jgi:hypothetical protein
MVSIASFTRSLTNEVNRVGNFTYTDDFSLRYVSFTIDLNVPREHPPITEASKEDSAWAVWSGERLCANTHPPANRESEL